MTSSTLNRKHCTAFESSFLFSSLFFRASAAKKSSLLFLTFVRTGTLHHARSQLVLTDTSTFSSSALPGAIVSMGGG
jgi:hypothetical protein